MVDPFVANSLDYNSILVTWNTPANPSPSNVNNPQNNTSGQILAYRLIKNRFGFPVDQDDGEILIDTGGFPGNQFVDTDVVPGTYNYYGFYILIDDVADTWVRSGWTACLAIKNYNSGLTINQLIPSFYRLPNTDIQNQVESNFPSTDLDFFTEVLGWGVDYLKTQYDTYLNINNPWTISEKDLYNLGTQLGININPDIHPYTLRKAIYYNAPVTQQRGTLTGIEQELDVLTGWDGDIRIASNFMLNNDQSAFLDPMFTAWSPYISYNIDELVSYGNYMYVCSATPNIGIPPTGTSSNNTQWTVEAFASSALSNPLTGYPSTWELIYPNGGSNGVPPVFSLTEQLGTQDPLNSANFIHNSLKAINNSGSTITMWVRTLSRSESDQNTVPAPFAPNKDQVVGDGLPVPFVYPQLIWNGTSWDNDIRYSTNSILTYSFQPYMALRASTNFPPPYTTRAGSNNEWAPVGFDSRIRICISAYLTASVNTITAKPFVEWYDNNGNYITRVISRGNGVNASVPTGFAYDSFTSGANTAVNGRTTDDGVWAWVQQAGTFDVSPYDGGCVYPSNSSQRTYALVNPGVSNCQVAVTFVTAPNLNFISGIVFRWLDDTDYLIATMLGIGVVQGGTFTSLGTYPSPANVGDRLVLQLNGSTITALINNVQVLQVTSTFNQTQTLFGLIYDAVSTGGGGGGGGSVTVTNPGSQTSTVGTPI